MLDGARCVGKSYIAEEFARNEDYMGEGKYQILWCGVNATILSSQRNPSLRRRFSYLPRPPQAFQLGEGYWFHKGAMNDIG